MSHRRLLPVALLSLLCAALAACAAAGGGPSLQPRAAEAIDPRLPVVDGSAALPADAGFVASVAALRARGEAVAGEADRAIEAAAGPVAGAGGREGESWIAAQQAVSVAVAARAPFARAQGDLDSLLAERVRGGGRLVPGDIAAHRTAAEALAAIDARQARRLAEFERRLQR